MDEQKEMNFTKETGNRNWLGIGLALLLATAAFFSGLQIGSGTDSKLPMEAGLFSLFAAPPQPAEGVDLTEFWRVWSLMEEKFVKDADSVLTEEERVEGAIAGLVASYGDPYTVFMPPVEASEFEETIAGNFSGVGMEVGLRENLITVIAPLPDTPAFTAGVLPGDVIVSIDGASTERMNLDEAVSLIRGERGTTVNLSLYRDGSLELLELAIVRDVITIPTIKTEEVGDVFVISLYNFNALAESGMQNALRAYTESGKKKLLLDLRGNPGGFLQSSISIASYFLPTGKVVLRESFGGETEEVLYRSQGRMLGSFAPEDMVILVDGGSASASEILAGALQEYKVATIIGDTTFGKGSVQELVRLPNGSSLKVTIARWFTPEGRSISEGGLEPDIFVERTPEDRVNEVDPQKDAALRWLGGDRSFEMNTKETESATE
jgi:carboxyl-terminal processing protease